MGFLDRVGTYFNPVQVQDKFSTPSETVNQLGTNLVINILLPLISVGAVLSLVYGGYLYLTAGGDAEKSETAKRVIMYSVIAIVIIIASFAIYNTVIGLAS